MPCINRELIFCAYKNNGIFLLGASCHLSGVRLSRKPPVADITRVDRNSILFYIQPTLQLGRYIQSVIQYPLMAIIEFVSRSVTALNYLFSYYDSFDIGAECNWMGTQCTNSMKNIVGTTCIMREILSWLTNLQPNTSCAIYSNVDIGPAKL